MNAVSRILRKLSVRSNGSQEFYGAIARNGANGSPHYNESRRDYEAVRRNSDRYTLF